MIREQQKIALQEEIVDYDAYRLKPNKMQEEFICSVHDLIERGARKALLISATGTGKTYASAFAMRNERQKKALFIVHRELIARQALKSYRKVFGNTKKLALLSGNFKEVLMLRPTESPIVFVQQLGRGLRKAEDKEYVVIIDFIGNYTNNYMIPIALSGDRSYNKDSIRRYVAEGTRIIPGASTIHFDEISRKRIFQSIDSARTNDVRLLKESFEQLKYRLGRISTVLDFKKYGSVDVSKYFEKFGSYYAFLIKYYSGEYKIRSSEEEACIIEFISKKVTNMKRIYELALL